MVAPSPLSPQGHRIGEAARLSGLPAANIRFYEQQGLLPAQARGENRYRVYGAADIHRLRFIRLCRTLDMSLEEVRTLLGLNLHDKADCTAAREALDDHLAHVRERLAELRALEGELKALRASCDGSGPHCHLIEALHARAEAAAPAPARRRGPAHVRGAA